MSYVKELQEIGSAALGRAVNQTLYVSVNGSGTNGRTWASAYNTIQAALDAASVDGDDATLIMIAPHTTNYDINTTGDPTWAGNYILAGASCCWSKIKNTHGTATSIMKFTGNVMLSKLNFNLGTGSVNGVILTHGGTIVDDCKFIGEDLTGAATGLHIDGATAKHGKIIDCEFDGHITHMTGLLLDNCAHSEVESCRFHYCLTAIQVIHADSDDNLFTHIDIGECTLALDIDAGNEQHFKNIVMHNNTVNVDDEVGDHLWDNIFGDFPMTIEPDDFTGVTIVANALANTWGVDTELRAAVTSTKPFRIVSIFVIPNISQLHRIRFSHDAGTSFYDDVIINATKQAGAAPPSGTEHIFNKGTRISASMKALTGGSDTAVIWLKIQEI